MSTNIRSQTFGGTNKKLEESSSKNLQGKTTGTNTSVLSTLSQNKQVELAKTNSSIGTPNKKHFS